ncbi:A-kinase anchor protein 14 isoform X2 [Cuculus canorus]|uniref:A-kinase anchor protein 14 isoform X2 n=1 Tax=Cuculus canorus TaxID=55661 RepID=UPI0023AAE7A9|nr:A-kinase anchor protein 14 isoform X2 [Cuculus canorus]
MATGSKHSLDGWIRQQGASLQVLNLQGGQDRGNQAVRARVQLPGCQTGTGILWAATCLRPGPTHWAKALRKQQQSLCEAMEKTEKGEEDAASEEKAHVIMETGTSGTDLCLPELEKKEKETKYVIKNIQWTTGNNFTVERGQQQIEELISTWKVHESWLHWSEFLQEEELEHSKRYHYRVCWSIPTRRKPIPRATASVYFVIEISKTKPAVSTLKWHIAVL